MISGVICLINSYTKNEVSTKIPFHNKNFTFQRKIIATSHANFQLAFSPNKKETVSHLENENYIILTMARFDYLDDLAIKLGISHTQILNLSKSEIVLRAYKKWSKDCVHYLEGNWVFLVWNKKNKQLLIAKEPYGDNAVYYYHHQSFFIFSTQIKDIINHPNVVKILNSNIIMSKGWKLPKDHQTYYKNIFLLPSAHYLTFHQNNLELNNYWLPNKQKTIRYKNENDYTEQFIEIFRRSVKERIGNNNGIALSSGLDSTSITALLAPILAKQDLDLKAITWYTDKISKEVYSKKRTLNEVDLARYFVRNYENIEHTTVKGMGKIIDTIHFLLEIYEQPTYSNIHYLEIIKSAHQLGIKTLFTGAIGNFTISYQGDKNEYYRTLLSSFKLFTFFQQIMLRKNTDNWIRTIYHTIYQPFFEKHLPYRKKVHLYKKIGSILNKQALEENMPNFRFYSQQRLIEALNKNDYPIKPFLKNFQHNNNIRHQPLYDYYDINIVEPAVDKRLIDFCFSLPNNIYFKDGQEKYLLKKVMNEFIPSKILNNKKRGKQAANLHYKFRQEYNEVRAAFETFRESTLASYWLNIDYLLGLLQRVNNMDYKSTKEKSWSVFFLQNGLSLGFFLMNFDKK